MPIRKRGDLAEALMQPRAFVFLWVNWAVHARWSESVVRSVVEAWQAANPGLVTPCYVADLSDQCGEVWDAIREWLEAEERPACQLMMSGVGPLPWVRSGRVIAHEMNPNQAGPAKLAAITLDIFTPIPLQDPPSGTTTKQQAPSSPLLRRRPLNAHRNTKASSFPR